MPKVFFAIISTFNLNKIVLNIRENNNQTFWLIGSLYTKRKDSFKLNKFSFNHQSNLKQHFSKFRVYPQKSLL